MYIVQYWTLLDDVGQVQPTLYERTGTFPGSWTPYTYSAKNNIFINPALYQIYDNYFRSTILPLLGIQTAPPKVAPPSSSDSLNPRFITFEMGYVCTESQQKPWPSLILAIVIGDYTILSGCYLGFKRLVELWIRKRHEHDETGTWASRAMIDARELVRRMCVA